MADLGTGYIRIAPNMTGIQGKIAAGMKGAGSQATSQLGDEVNRNSGPFQNAIGKLGGIAKVGGLAIAGGIAAGAVGLATLASKMVLAGSQLEQQLGGSEAVFGEFARNIQATADDAYTNMGLSQNEFLAGANKMGSLYQGAGITVQKSMEMSAASIQRATDVASIMGIDTTMALESVTAMAKGNFTMMDNLGVAMNDTAINAFALEKGLGKTTSQMSQAEKVGLATQLFMEKTAKFAGNYAKENDTLAGSINTTKKAFQDFLATGNITGFINSLVKTIEIAVPKIIEILPKIVSGLGSILSGVVPALSKALPVLIPALISAVQSLLNALVTALPTVIQTLLKALPIFIAAFVQIFLSLIKALPQIVAIIGQALPVIIDALVVGLTSPESLQAIIMGAVQLLLAIVTAIPIIIPALVAAVPLIIQNIIATLTDPKFILALVYAGAQLIRSVINGIISMGTAVAKAAWKIVETISNTLSANNMINIGKDVVKGLWNGIQDMGGWLKDKIVGFVKDKIPGPIRKALGISSPSKVAAMLGKQVPAGLAQGINAAAGLVEKAATDMANGAIAGMTTPAINPSLAFGSAGGAAPAGGSQSNTNQTVTIGTVVLGDSSAVREFFKKLNQDTINVGLGMTPVQGAQP